MGKTRIRLALLLFGLAATTAVVQAGNWPQFRGPDRNAISGEKGLLRQWPEGGPKVLWSTDVGQGYSAAAIHDGTVYFNDYDEAKFKFLVRALNLEDGKELWRFKEPRRIRPNHAITRSVPATDGKYVFSLDPKTVLHALDATTGQEIWRKNFVKEYRTKIPPWYNGQCPLIDRGRLIVAPAGADALVVALDPATGEEIWRTPNPEGWLLSHASVMPAKLGGVDQYLFSVLQGTVGVSAADGKLLWHFPFKFNVSVSPSPLPIDSERVYVTAAYESGGAMFRVKRDGDTFITEQIFGHAANEWNSEAHTPILHDKHLFAVGKKRRGLFTCLDLDGKKVWDSDGQAYFGLGSFILADGMFIILEGDTGMLRLLEASTKSYTELASAQILDGHDVWAPLALSDGKLVIRDLGRMVCLDLKGAGKGEAMTTALKFNAARTIGGKGSGAHRFSEALRGIAIDVKDRIYVAGDSAVKTFDSEGALRRHWPTASPGYCIAVDAKGIIWVGQWQQVEVFDGEGRLQDTRRDPDRLGLITEIAFWDGDVFLGDATARCIHRYDGDGNFLNDIGDKHRKGGFHIPNGVVDFDIDSSGIIHVANPGMHRVESYKVDGELLGRFGRFDGQDPAGFPGCCNPTNLTVDAAGRVLVTEKAGPRAKVYDADGQLLAVIADDVFDPAAKNMDLAVDSSGRVYVVDTARLEIRVFQPEPRKVAR